MAGGAQTGTSSLKSTQLAHIPSLDRRVMTYLVIIMMMMMIAIDYNNYDDNDDRNSTMMMIIVTGLVGDISPGVSELNKSTTRHGL